METKHPLLAPPTLRVVWPEHEADFWRTGFHVKPMSAHELAAHDAANGYVPSRWEERFDIGQIQAILHLLEHLTAGLPGAVRRLLLRRADQFPRLHGRFAPFHGRLGFHAEEGEVIGPGECWREGENGKRERLW